MWVIIVWWNEDQKDAMLLPDYDGSPRLFSTQETAEEWCNTELNSHYKVIELEN